MEKLEIRHLSLSVSNIDFREAVHHFSRNLSASNRCHGKLDSPSLNGDGDGDDDGGGDSDSDGDGHGHGDGDVDGEDDGDGDGDDDGDGDVENLTD